LFINLINIVELSQIDTVCEKFWDAGPHLLGDGVDHTYPWSVPYESIFAHLCVQQVLQREYDVSKI